MLLLFRFGSAGIGPFHVNAGGLIRRAQMAAWMSRLPFPTPVSAPAGASCRISASGAPDFRDYVFFTQPIQPGETRTFTQTVPPVPDAAPLSAATLVVTCS